MRYDPSAMKTPKITKKQALAAYDNSVKALADALGISHQAVYKWPSGPIPEEQTLKLYFMLKPGRDWSASATKAKKLAA